MTALELAILFHETYERLAPRFGYETRTDTRAFDPNSSNGKLMGSVCDEILAHCPQLTQAQMKNRLYEIWLDLGAVFHVLDNHDDASRGADLLEPAMERLEELWR